MSNTSQELQAITSSPLFTEMNLETRLGALYVMPDMLPEHVDIALRQLHDAQDPLLLRNVSQVTMVIPLQIIRYVYLHNDKVRRCVWEAND